ncbi:MAG TPA: hypothetical protein VMF67_14405 [Rhizomicrobium sp.]|nr:hypothetical protein [Rhizomicrobium sp.]
MYAYKHGLLAITLAVAAVAAQPASAALYKTSCHKRDCVRLECDDRGAICFRLGYFRRDSYDEAAPSCQFEDFGAPSGGIGSGGSGCGSGSNPEYHYLNHFDPNNDYAEYPGFDW